MSAMQPMLYSDRHLHAVQFTPAGAPRARVLLVSPLFDEKRCAHRALVMGGHALAQAGAQVLLPDLFGTGNSHGVLTDIALDRWMDDLHAAAEALPGEAPLCVVGCRAGALLAAHAVAGGLAAARLLLWQPAVSGRGYLTQARTRRMIQDKMTGDTPPETDPCEVEGEILSPALQANLQALRLPVELPASVDLRWLQCSFNDKLLAEYERVIAQWGPDRIHTRCVAVEPFWHPHTPSNYAELAAVLTEEVLA